MQTNRIQDAIEKLMHDSKTFESDINDGQSLIADLQKQKAALVAQEGVALADIKVSFDGKMKAEAQIEILTALVKDGTL